MIMGEVKIEKNRRYRHYFYLADIQETLALDFADRGGQRDQYISDLRIFDFPGLQS